MNNKGFTPVVVVLAVAVVAALLGALAYYYVSQAPTLGPASKVPPVVTLESSPPAFSQTPGVSPTPPGQKTIPPPPTSGSSGKKIIVRDCGADFECFTAAAEGCTPSKMKNTTTLNNNGILITAVSQLELSGTSGKCTWVTTTLDDQASLTPDAISTLRVKGTSETDIANAETQIEQTAKSMIGDITTCSYAVNDLVPALRRWRGGTFGTADKALGSCKTTE